MQTKDATPRRVRFTSTSRHSPAAGESDSCHYRKSMGVAQVPLSRARVEQYFQPVETRSPSGEVISDPDLAGPLGHAENAKWLSPLRVWRQPLSGRFPISRESR